MFRRGLRVFEVALGCIVTPLKLHCPRLMNHDTLPNLKKELPPHCYSRVGVLP